MCIRLRKRGLSYERAFVLRCVAGPEVLVLDGKSDRSMYVLEYRNHFMSAQSSLKLYTTFSFGCTSSGWLWAEKCRVTGAGVKSEWFTKPNPLMPSREICIAPKTRNVLCVGPLLLCVRAYAVF